MTRIHDMGGRFGDGPVEPGESDAPPFSEDWHKRALALTLASGALGRWNLDMSRHARETVPPKDYVRFSYYERWLAGLCDLLVTTGVVTKGELAGDTPAPAFSERILKATDVPGVLAKGGPTSRDSDIAPRFSVGDAVRAVRPAENRLVNGGHTRLPAYAAGARGRVVLRHGAHVLPDSNAHGLGEAPEPLYAVAFLAADLWAAPENPNDEVILDLWQSYLEPA